MYKRIINEIKENYLIFILFSISTLFFLYQHFSWLSWDFSAYVLNAKHLFYNGNYFEIYRAPMTSILLGISLIFGKFGEYLYILFVSILFFYSVIQITNSAFKKYIEINKKEEKFLQFLFYFFLLSSFTLNYGTQIGTELLGFSFLLLFLSNILKNKISGHYLALAFLTRYNFLIFLPLLFFYKDFKKIIKNILLFALIVFPWFLFNYLVYQNWFTSIIESYYLNIYSRIPISEPFNFSILFPLFGYFFPLFLIGLVLCLLNLFRIRTKELYNNKVIIVFLIVFVFTIYDFYNTPFKIARYLFNLTLPIAYFSVIGTFFLTKRYIKKNVITIIILLVIFILTTFSLYMVFYSLRFADNQFSDSAKDIKRLDLKQCEILSPHWPLVSYYTENVYPLGTNNIQTSIFIENKTILIFKGEITIDDLFNLTKLYQYYPVLYETNKYVFFAQNLTSKTCSKKYFYDARLVKNPCQILSENFKKIKLDKLALKICNLINKPVFN